MPSTETIQSNGKSSTNDPISDAQSADFHYLRHRPENAHQPLSFEIEYILGMKDKDTRNLPVTDIRNIDPKSKDAQLKLDNAGFQYINHRSEFLAAIDSSGRDATSAEDVTKDQWGVAYFEELKDVLQKQL